MVTQVKRWHPTELVTVLFCIFGARSPQIQPPFICLLQLPPQYILHIQVQDHQQQRKPLGVDGGSDPLGSWGVHRGWAWTSVLMGSVQKERLGNGRIWIEFWTGLGWISKWTQSKHKPSDWDLTCTWVTSPTAELEAQWGPPTALLCLIKFYLLKYHSLLHLQD